MTPFLTVFIGAGIGGALRHGVNVAALRLLGSAFPFGTLSVNVIGGLLMGLIVEWFALKADASQTLRLFLTTGVLGGFTTFSAFSLETALMIERGEYSTAGFYAALSVVASVTGLFAGLFLIRVGT